MRWGTRSSTIVKSRIQAARNPKAMDSFSATASVTFKNLVLASEASQVLKERFPIALTRKERALLDVLVSAGGDAVSRQTLLDRCWPGVNVTVRTIDTHVATLRQKLGRGPGGQTYIATVRNVGYRMNPQA